MIEALYQSGSFVFSTLNGRYFIGQMEDGELVGAYSTRAAAYSVSFAQTEE